MKDFSEEEIQEFEQQLDDADVTAILLQQTAYLDAILRELQGTRDDSSGETHTCKHCAKEIPESDLQEHAESHNLPPGMDVMSCYE